jgi:regulator of PEP synthase PpsR (kinase-PPPase family)
VIDVSELSIEEIAQRILRAVQRRGLGASAS